MFKYQQKEFRLVRTSLMRMACPREVEALADNRNPAMSVVLSVNDRGYGRVERTQYTPEAIVIAGAYRRKWLMQKDVIFDYAYVEAGLDIHADDEISCDELMSRLRNAVCMKILGRLEPLNGQSWPYIVQVYPFENYCIFRYKDDLFRQGYYLDPVAKVVRLHEGAQKVNEKFVNAGGPGSGPRAHADHPFHKTITNAGFVYQKDTKGSYPGVGLGTEATIHNYTDGGRSAQLGYSLGGRPYAKVDGDKVHDAKSLHKVLSASVDEMPMVQTGLRYSSAPAAGNNQTMTQGGSRSELVTDTIRDWKNVLEAVAMYLAAIRNGQHKPSQMITRPSFAPVNLTPAGKLGEQLRAAGIDVYDFAIWSARMQAGEKTKEGLPPASYAYVGDPKDTSTWHLKIHDKAHVADALSRVNQVKGIPQTEKAGVMNKLHRLAKKHGIDVTKKPTPKQNTWMEKGKERYA